jgi:ESCRT-I complex subunit VPS28
MKRIINICKQFFNRYTAACSKLLVQYKAAFKQVQNEEFPTVERFMKKYKVIIATVLKIVFRILPFVVVFMR